LQARNGGLLTFKDRLQARNGLSQVGTQPLQVYNGPFPARRRPLLARKRGGIHRRPRPRSRIASAYGFTFWAAIS